jgi:indole-3-glycerol phosphate synthase
MSTVLEEICDGVREDVQARRLSASQLAEHINQAPAPRDAYSALSGSGISVIAEVKRASPSKGELADIANPAELAEKYADGGASVISVLTEQRRFKGSIADFREVREAVELPLLRKDFIVTEYQVQESRAIGADLQLLIVAALSDSQLKDFYQMTEELGMNSLIEIHDEAELERALNLDPKIIGVNSRNLKDLSINGDAFERLLPLIPSSVVAVAESGISLPAQVSRIQELGGRAILVGETLVRAGEPAHAIRQLLGE